jgi:hypothetical protein
MPKKKYCIIDTNILITANDRETLQGRETPQVDVSGVLKCQQFLRDVMETMTVSLDSDYEIMIEYQNKNHIMGRPGLGDYFLKYLSDNIGYADRCELVDIPKHTNGDYVVFDEHPGLKAVDPSDQKFVAVYLVCGHENAIYNACDSDWQEQSEVLQSSNVKVIELLKKDPSTNTWHG